MTGEVDPVFARRLKHLLEKAQPQIEAEERDDLAEFVATLVGAQDKEPFWRAFYGVPL